MEEVNLASESLLTSLHWMLRQTCIKKKKKWLPYKCCDSCYSQAPFPYRKEKMSLREGKNQDLRPPLRSIASTPPFLACSTCESSNLLGKRKQFLPGIPLSKNHYHSGLLVYLSRQHPHLSETCPLRSALVAPFVLDEPTHMASTSQGKHSDPRRELILPRYSLDVGHQNASWSLWSLK